MDENKVETEELGDIDYFEGWDDDSDTEDVETVETEAEDNATEEVQDQPTEGAENEAEEETKEPESRSWKLKHNGEEVDADEAKMVELAQKGLDYDRVRTERDTFKNEHPKYADYEKFLEEMAESAGTDVPGLMESVRVSLLVKKAKDEGKVLSEAAAIQQVRSLSRATPEKVEAPAADSEETRRRETIRAFCQTHPTVKAEDIPLAVLQEGVSSGDLSGAYDRWEIKQLKEKLGDAQKELETIKQNQKNKERSTGSKRNSGSVSVDPWFDGWPDD